MKRYKKYFGALILLTILLFGIHNSFLFSARMPLRSRLNLQRYERNLDVLKDKEGSLNQLIGEVQGYTITTTSGGAIGSTITISGIDTNDAIFGAVVYSSGNNVAASTTTGNGATLGEGQVKWTSKLGGAMGNNIMLSYVLVSTAVSGGTTTLTVNTTGYNIEVRISTGSDGVNGSSITALLTAVRNNEAANYMVSVASVSCGSCTITAASVSSFRIGTGVSGNGTPQSATWVDGSVASMTATGKVWFTTKSFITVNDMVEWHWYDRPEAP